MNLTIITPWLCMPPHVQLHDKIIFISTYRLVISRTLHHYVCYIIACVILCKVIVYMRGDTEGAYIIRNKHSFYGLTKPQHG